MGFLATKWNDRKKGDYDASQRNKNRTESINRDNYESETDLKVSDTQGFDCGLEIKRTMLSEMMRIVSLANEEEGKALCP